jgi:hypothetical protein
VEEVGPGLWAWAARHPDWKPGFGWDERVRCFVVETEPETLVVDPLVEGDDWTAVDDVVGAREARAAIVLTQAAHARQAGEAAARYGAGVWAHEYAREKVGGAEFHPIRHGDDVPGAAEVLAFDEEPGGSGTPLYVPSHAAVAVGDVFISVDGELRVWWTSRDEEEERWYRERYVPSLRRWLERPIERILVAHGDPVPGGVDALAAALERPPYAHD